MVPGVPQLGDALGRRNTCNQLLLQQHSTAQGCDKHRLSIARRLDPTSAEGTFDFGFILWRLMAQDGLGKGSQSTLVISGVCAPVLIPILQGEVPGV